MLNLLLLLAFVDYPEVCCLVAFLVYLAGLVNMRCGRSYRPTGRWLQLCYCALAVWSFKLLPATRPPNCAVLPHSNR